MLVLVVMLLLSTPAASSCDCHQSLSLGAPSNKMFSIKSLTSEYVENDWNTAQKKTVRKRSAVYTHQHATVHRRTLLRLPFHRSYQNVVFSKIKALPPHYYYCCSSFLCCRYLVAYGVSWRSGSRTCSWWGRHKHVRGPKQRLKKRDEVRVDFFGWTRESIWQVSVSWHSLLFHAMFNFFHEWFIL